MSFKMNRKENAIMQARMWNELTERTLSEYTEQSVKDTKLYDNRILEGVTVYNRYSESEIIFRVSDTTSTIHEFLKIVDTEPGYTYKKVAALNFASFTHPGGGFINGCNAQEETLCQTSNLYNVLSRKKSFYKKNTNRKPFKPNYTNSGLYSNRLLYNPGILFVSAEDILNEVYKKETRACDIITCAAPNANHARLKGIPEDVIIKAMIKRIRFLLTVAYERRVDVLILGAFGCGCFGNNPKVVFPIYKYLLDNKFKNVFYKIVFAVPDEKLMNEIVVPSINDDKNMTPELKRLLTEVCK